MAVVTWGVEGAADVVTEVVELADTLDVAVLDVDVEDARGTIT